MARIARSGHLASSACAALAAAVSTCSQLSRMRSWRPLESDCADELEATDSGMLQRMDSIGDGGGGASRIIDSCELRKPDPVGERARQRAGQLDGKPCFAGTTCANDTDEVVCAHEASQLIELLTTSHEPREGRTNARRRDKRYPHVGRTMIRDHRRIVRRHSASRLTTPTDLPCQDRCTSREPTAPRRHPWRCR